MSLLFEGRARRFFLEALAKLAKVTPAIYFTVLGSEFLQNSIKRCNGAETKRDYGRTGELSRKKVRNTVQRG